MMFKIKKYIPDIVVADHFDCWDRLVGLSHDR